MALPVEKKRNPPLQLGLLRQAVQITDAFRDDEVGVHEETPNFGRDKVQPCPGKGRGNAVLHDRRHGR